MARLMELIPAMTTEQHLDNWLARHFDPNDDIVDIRAAMLALIAQKPWMLDQGWWRVFDAIKEGQQ
jgi:hypothetical protein